MGACVRNLKLHNFSIPASFQINKVRMWIARNWRNDQFKAINSEKATAISNNVFLAKFVMTRSNKRKPHLPFKQDPGIFVFISDCQIVGHWPDKNFNLPFQCHPSALGTVLAPPIGSSIPDTRPLLTSADHQPSQPIPDHWIRYVPIIKAPM